jgi:hypothetical protein
MAGSTGGTTQPTATQPQPYQQPDNIFQTARDTYNRAVNTRPTGGASSGSGGGGLTNVTAGQIATTDLSPYMNPFQSNVIDATAQQVERARQQAMMMQGAQATAAGAFGGSRHGVADSQTMGEFDRNWINALSGLNYQNFSNAQNMGQFDIGARLSAQQGNQKASLEAEANRVAMAQARAAQQNAAANMMMSRANTSNIGFGMGMQMNNAMMQAGASQQALQQQLIDQAMGQYGGWAASPVNSTQGVNQAIGAVPGGGGSTTTRNPGLFDYLTLAATVMGSGCWVAREVYGPTNPAWLEFREWMAIDAPDWLRRAYMKHGPKLAEWVARNPWAKRVLRPLMDLARKSQQKERAHV